MEKINWKPEAEIVRFETVDIITTSGVGPDLGENEGDIVVG